jgi:hypothetical protein
MAGAGVSIDVRHNRLPQLATKLHRELVDITEGAGKVGVRVARQRVPVLTGALKESIHVEGSGLKLKVASEKDYAAIIEYGGRNRLPQPYMRPGALAATLYIKVEINKLAGRLEAL